MPAGALNARAKPGTLRLDAYTAAPSFAAHFGSTGGIANISASSSFLPPQPQPRHLQPQHQPHQQLQQLHQQQQPSRSFQAASTFALSSSSYSGLPASSPTLFVSPRALSSNEQAALNRVFEEVATMLRPTLVASVLPPPTALPTESHPARSDVPSMSKAVQHQM
jgi:hypothetical protein